MYITLYNYWMIVAVNLILGAIGIVLTIIGIIVAKYVAKIWNKSKKQ